MLFNLACSIILYAFRWHKNLKRMYLLYQRFFMLCLHFRFLRADICTTQTSKWTEQHGITLNQHNKCNLHVFVLMHSNFFIWLTFCLPGCLTFQLSEWVFEHSAGFLYGNRRDCYCYWRALGSFQMQVFTFPHFISILPPLRLHWLDWCYVTFTFQVDNKRFIYTIYTHLIRNIRRPDVINPFRSFSVSVLLQVIIFRVGRHFF